MIDTILKKQNDISTSFLKHKDAIHAKEDHELLDEMSEILDLRNWNVVVFDPKSNVNEKNGAADDEIEVMFSLCTSIL